MNELARRKAVQYPSVAEDKENHDVSANKLKLNDPSKVKSNNEDSLQDEKSHIDIAVSECTAKKKKKKKKSLAKSKTLAFPSIEGFHDNGEHVESKVQYVYMIFVRG